MLQHNIFLARVGRVVRDAVVEAEACGKAHAGLEAVSRLQPRVSEERAHAILDVRRNALERLTRLDVFLSPLPDLTMDFRGLAVIMQEGRVLEMATALVTQFRSSRASCVDVMGIAKQLSGRIVSSRKESAQRHSRRRRLLCGNLGFLLLVLYFFLLCTLIGFQRHGAPVIVVVVAASLVSTATISIAGPMRTPRLSTCGRRLGGERSAAWAQ